jgi:hypothetical protein
MHGSTPAPGIYLTDDFSRAATGYGRGGQVGRVRVPKSFADSVFQLGGPKRNQPEFFVNTQEGVDQLNQTLEVRPTNEAIRMHFGGQF